MLLKRATDTNLRLNDSDYKKIQCSSVLDTKRVERQEEGEHWAK